MAGEQIRYIPHHQIDKRKWDDCLRQSSNGLIYGYSFYLDHMAKNWDGLVLNDYQAVMPLCWNRKYGFYYLYRPFVCAAGGVFGTNALSRLAGSFLEHIPHKFRYWDFPLNSLNSVDDSTYTIRQRRNFVLPLSSSYEILYSHFNENTKRNIKKAETAGCYFMQPDFETVIAAAKAQLKNVTRVANEDFDRLLKLCQWLKPKGATSVYGIAAPNGQLLSSCIFFIWQNRAYYILPGNLPQSKNTGASHALINTFIKVHAGSNMIFDFEGSDIPSVAQFYSGFGAIEESYPAVKYNNLPSIIKTLKR